MLKALLKSNIAISTCFLLSYRDVISCIVSSSCVSHDSALQKPCCNLDSILYISRWSKICLHTMCSSSLQHTQVRDIGL